MSHIHTQHLSESPNIFSLFSKAVLPKKIVNKTTKKTIIPKLSVDLKGVKTDAKLLKQYRHVCGFESKAHLPSTFPHIMAFPLHMKLLTDSKFPLPLLGLVHLKNSITQYRPLNTNELFDITCSLSEGRSSTIGTSTGTTTGTTFDIVTKLTVAGKIVWEESTTILYRAKNSGTKATKNYPKLPVYQNSEEWTLPTKLGREYAKVSSDFNLIHLYSWSAKIFGFNKAIIHGMWTKTRCIAALTEQLGDQPFKVDVNFKLPVFLPNTLKFNWQQKDKAINFQLVDENMTKPHLKGHITLL